MTDRTWELDLDSLTLDDVDGGTRLRLRVHSKARRSAIVGVRAGALKVSVTAAPERGKANEAVVDLLADILGVPRSAVRVVSGATSPDKVVEVRGVRSSLVRSRLGTHR